MSFETNFDFQFSELWAVSEPLRVKHLAVNLPLKVGKNYSTWVSLFTKPGVESISFLWDGQLQPRETQDDVAGRVRWLKLLLRRLKVLAPSPSHLRNLRVRFLRKRNPKAKKLQARRRR